MSNWIKTNWGVLVILTLIGAFLFAGTSCAALDFASNEPVRVPLALRDIGDPEQLPLSEAKITFKASMAALEQFAENITNAELRAEFKAQLFTLLTEKFDTAAGMAVPGWSAFGGTALVAGIAGALGFRKPGDLSTAEARKREDDAYDLGAREALEKFRAGQTSKV